MVCSTSYQGSILQSMKILKDNHCPNCGVELDRVRQGIPNTPCGMFHVYPGIARLVIKVVNGQQQDINTIVRGGDIITETAGDTLYESVDDAVIAVLDTMHDIQFPKEAE